MFIAILEDLRVATRVPLLSTFPCLEKLYARNENDSIVKKTQFYRFALIR